MHISQKPSLGARRYGTGLALAFCLLFIFVSAVQATVESNVEAQSPAALRQECRPAIVVQNSGNSGPGTLRQAMEDICVDGVITFAGDMTIVLSEELSTQVSMTLDGDNRRVTIHGNHAVRVISVDNDSSLTIHQLTIAGGASGRGAGINVTPGASLDLNRSLLVDNRCVGPGQGCGLQNDSVAIIRNSTISGNQGFQGAGIQNDNIMTLVNVTFSNNSGDSHPNLVNYGTLTLRNSILAGGGCGNFQTMAANTNNIIEGGGCEDGAVGLQTGDPGLSQLGDFGGPTFTHAFSAESIARNAGDTAVCAGPLVNNLDQRGRPRPGNGSGGCDIGAYELQEEAGGPVQTIYLPGILR